MTSLSQPRNPAGPPSRNDRNQTHMSTDLPVVDTSPRRARHWRISAQSLAAAAAASGELAPLLALESSELREPPTRQPTRRRQGQQGATLPGQSRSTAALGQPIKQVSEFAEPAVVRPVGADDHQRSLRPPRTPDSTASRSGPASPAARFVHGALRPPSYRRSRSAPEGKLTLAIPSASETGAGRASAMATNAINRRRRYDRRL